MFRSTRSPERLGSGGFSLVEVIAALAILAVALVAVMQLFSSSLESTRRSDVTTRSLMYARALLEEACAAPDPREMEDSLDLEGGMRAVVSVLPAGDPDAKPERYTVTVELSAPSGETTTLSCLRVLHEKE